METIYKTREVDVPRSLIEKGYSGKAMVNVYQIHEGEFELWPQIGFDFKGPADFLNKAITIHAFKGTKEKAIEKAEKMISEVKKWPDY
ncbi:MAG: hypothetical protein NTY20_03890 [Candidatus Aenigmarchaeota archaeon]|nr:hypothetical protein [Candidatus Aenigmarchaeota archaeon]